MPDARKFHILMYAAATLTLLILAYNVSQDLFMPGIEGYIKRRLYFEQVISKKGLDLHKGMHWKEKE